MNTTIHELTKILNQIDTENDDVKQAAIAILRDVLDKKEKEDKLKHFWDKGEYIVSSCDSEEPPFAIHLDNTNFNAYKNASQWIYFIDDCFYRSEFTEIVRTVLKVYKKYDPEKYNLLLDEMEV